MPLRNDGDRRAVRFDASRIDAIFSPMDRCHAPGVAVGIAIASRPVYRKAFGLANIELPVLLAPTMRMRIASITKHFAALAYALLCEAGKARMDDRVALHLPDLHPVTHRVTMRELMGHVSGLRDACDICWQFSGTGHRVSSEEMLSLYRDIDDVNCAPGTAWSYNNGGYLMLSAAIERITGQSLEDVFRERIFEPAGLFDTRLRRFDTDFLPNSATLHMRGKDGGFEKSYAGTAVAGEGGIVSTVDDMLRWMAHMENPIVGNAATWRMMMEPLRLIHGTSTGYGLGLTIGQYRGVTTISHAGSVMGGNAQMIKVPSAGLDVVILANDHNISSTLLANEVLDSLLDLPPAGEMHAEPFVTGTFRSPATGRIVQLFARSGRQFVSVDGYDRPVLRGPEGVLHPTPEWSFLKQTLTLDDLTKPVSIDLDDFGAVDALVAVPPIEHDDAADIAGTYRSDTTATRLSIAATDAGPRLTTMGRFGSVVYGLERLAEDAWRVRSLTAMPWGGVLSMGRAREVISFTSPRTRALVFRRAT